MFPWKSIAILLSALFLIVGASMAQVDDKGSKDDEESIEVVSAFPSNPIFFGGSSFFGTPWGHSSEILYNTRQPSFGVQASCLWQTTGKTDWSVAHRYPRVGVTATYMYIGDQDTLGTALSIAPTISFHILDRPKWRIRADVQYGFAYLNKYFDDLDNPHNNAVSSPYNAHVGSVLSAEFKMTEKWWFILGANYIHFSNGASTIPNLGINIIGGSLGLKYQPTSFSIDEFQKTGASTFKQNKWGGEVLLSLGYRQRQEAGGPSYPIYMLESAIIFRATVGQTMHLGFSYEYNRGAYVFGRHILLLTDLEEAIKAARRWTLFYGHEFRFGPVGLYLQIGANIYKKSQLLDGKIYNKYTCRYYLPTFSKPKTSFYASLTLKSYITVAEYYSFGIGASF